MFSGLFPPAHETGKTARRSGLKGLKRHKTIHARSKDVPMIDEDKIIQIIPAEGWSAWFNGGAKLNSSRSTSTVSQMPTIWAWRA